MLKAVFITDSGDAYDGLTGIIAVRDLPRINEMLNL